MQKAALCQARFHRVKAHSSEAERLAATTADNALLAMKKAWPDGYVSMHGAREEAFPCQRSFVEEFFPRTRSMKLRDGKAELDAPMA